MGRYGWKANKPHNNLSSSRHHMMSSIKVAVTLRVVLSVIDPVSVAIKSKHLLKNVNRFCTKQSGSHLSQGGDIVTF